MTRTITIADKPNQKNTRRRVRLNSWTVAKYAA